MNIVLTRQMLTKAFPTFKEDRIDMLMAALPAAMKKYDLNTVDRIASFLAQTAHESGMFKANIENLNYSATALRSIFGKYFTTDAAAKAAERKPEKIANIVYANRMGNGDTKSGDGWKFRGRGWLQITGRANVMAFAKYMELTLDAALAYLATPEGGFIAAGWFWEKNNLNALADRQDIVAISKKINGGTNGLGDRVSLYTTIRKALIQK